ncbi:hypothetical protein PR048_017882 [Dryococelus australis]|uniref:Uncharacterized protein n=1 Tax=Dryococelus australis TaxID=614101 RepID=A0ABQ9HAR5_9NEOP|nr:hypothetical protein PR048_017882 [Dryococelus australis]
MNAITVFEDHHNALNVSGETTRVYPQTRVIRSFMSSRQRNEREIPDKTRRPAASSGTVPTSEDAGVTRPGRRNKLLTGGTGKESPMALLSGAAVAEWLDYSPPTKANWWESCRTMPLVGGFSRGPPVSPSLHSSAAPFSTHFTLIGSEDLIVNNQPKSLNSTQSNFTKVPSHHLPGEISETVEIRNQDVLTGIRTQILPKRRFSCPEVTEESNSRQFLYSLYVHHNVRTPLPSESLARRYLSFSLTGIIFRVLPPVILIHVSAEGMLWSNVSLSCSSVTWYRLFASCRSATHYVRVPSVSPHLATRPAHFRVSVLTCSVGNLLRRLYRELQPHTLALWHPCSAACRGAVSQSAPGNILASRRPQPMGNLPQYAVANQTQRPLPELRTENQMMGTPTLNEPPRRFISV